MIRNSGWLLAGLSLAMVVPGAHAQDKKKLLFGPQLGFFTPSSQKTRERFGGSWTNIGIGLGDVAAPKESGELSIDFNILSSRAAQAEAWIAPIGLVYRKSSPESLKTRPYFGASVDYLVTNLRSNYTLDKIPSGWRTGTGGSFFGGVTVGNRFYIEGRYYAFTKVRGFDLSGTNIAIGWRL